MSDVAVPAQDSQRSAAARAELEQLAHAFGAASASGDNEALRALYADDAAIWHNTDDTTQTVTQNLKVSAWLHRTVPDLAIEDVSLAYTDDGFVRRGTLVGTAPNGATFRVHSILLVEVADGKVAKVFEYLDSAPLAVLQAR
jgi:ketosteroid isomerase-like protein